MPCITRSLRFPVVSNIFHLHDHGPGLKNDHVQRVQEQQNLGSCRDGQPLMPGWSAVDKDLFGSRFVVQHALQELLCVKHLPWDLLTAEKRPVAVHYWRIFLIIKTEFWKHEHDLPDVLPPRLLSPTENVSTLAMGLEDLRLGTS